MHASACTDLIRGIKEWDGGRGGENQNKMMTAVAFLFFSLFLFRTPPPPFPPLPCSVLSSVEHQMTGKALLPGLQWFAEEGCLVGEL